MSPLLELKELSVFFKLPEGNLRACEKVSFSLHRGESLGIVGESGSGKSVTMLATMGLIAVPPGNVSGKIFFNEKEMSSLESVRGRDVSMVFQNPLNSLNPSLRIGVQLAEVLTEHLGLSGAKANEKIVDTMNRLAIPQPEQMLKRYPFEFSGGMRQRVMIAMAMLCEPSLLIADEPTTALDVTNQAQILNLLKELQEKNDTAILFISHDMGVVSQIAQRIMVMYAGQQMEISPADEIFASPRHPYTQGLLSSIPGMRANERKKPLSSIPGSVPSLIKPPAGCRFHPRCNAAKSICSEKTPPAFDVGNSQVFCWLYEGGAS